MIDRRQFLNHIAGLTGVLLAPRLVLSRQTAASVTSLNDRLSLVNAGTNLLALSTGDGMVLVDTGAPESGASLMSRLSELQGGKHIQTVFNTHYHLENTGSNEALGKAGAKIIAHQSTLEWMATPYWVPAQSRYEKPRPKAALPAETFYTTGSLKAGAERIEYGYLIAAHTGGDIYVFFRDSNVMAAGGVVSPARDPELDYFTGAWIGGRVDAMDRLLKLSDGKTKIVPVFGPIMSRAEVQAERDMMKTIYDRTVDRVREGDSPEDMLKAGVLNGLARTFRDPGKFIYDVHKGLWAHHNKLAPNVV
jgi:cyclase